MPETNSAAPVAKRKWTFLRKFRWAVYIVFIAMLLFLIVCVAVGIISNLHERYRDLDIPVEPPESLSDLGSLQLRDCLTALEKLAQEQVEMGQDAFTGDLERDAFLSRWKAWSLDWRRRFESLGFSCRLTEYRYETHPTLGLLAEIYRRLDEIHRVFGRTVGRFVSENGQTLYEASQLMNRARQMIERIEGRPNSPP